MSEDRSQTEQAAVEAASSAARQAALKPGEPPSASAGVELNWDIGTAYDFFLSLHVLHMPEEFGLRASWAAGVRSRLTTAERKTLVTAQRVVHVPLCWIFALPEPKDAETALWALRQIPARQRLPTLVFCEEMSQKQKDLLNGVSDRGEWDENDLEQLRDAYRQKGKDSPRQKELAEILDTWADAEVFGERYLAALQSYYTAFFAEEQRRIMPALQTGLQRAQELAERLPLPELIEELSHGIHLDKNMLDTPEIIFVPSFWVSPLIFFTKVTREALLIAFGARPDDVSIVPGEQVPDSILLGLKALSDPTRLRILRYLTSDNMSPADLARRLRLRAPTVTHHLRALRLAGLVHLTVVTKQETNYTARLESINELCDRINSFLQSDEEA